MLNDVLAIIFKFLVCSVVVLMGIFAIMDAYDRYKQSKEFKEKQKMSDTYNDAVYYKIKILRDISSRINMRFICNEISNDSLRSFVDRFNKDINDAINSLENCIYNVKEETMNRPIIEEQLSMCDDDYIDECQKDYEKYIDYLEDLCHSLMKSEDRILEQTVEWMVENCYIECNYCDNNRDCGTSDKYCTRVILDEIRKAKKDDSMD